MNRVTKLGKPFVFVSGNHDSDTLERELARRGAIVLTDRGQLNKEGGPIVEVAGLKVAGYSDPFERRAGDGYADRFEAAPSTGQQNAFTAWLQPLLNKVDIVMVHQPALIEPALESLRDQAPPVRPIVFITGHTHIPSIDHTPGITVVNGGSVGAGAAPATSASRPTSASPASSTPPSRRSSRLPPTSWRSTPVTARPPPDGNGWTSPDPPIIVDESAS